jgi:hypothetical protein
MDSRNLQKATTMAKTLAAISEGGSRLQQCISDDEDDADEPFVQPQLSSSSSNNNSALTMTMTMTRMRRTAGPNLLDNLVLSLMPGGQRGGGYERSEHSATFMESMATGVFGGSAPIALCTISALYRFAAFFALLMLSWCRSMLVLQRVYASHIVSRKPQRASTAPLDRNVILEKPASRFVLFCVMVLTIASTCLYLGVLAIVTFCILQLIEIVCDTTPLSLWWLEDIMRAIFGVRNILGVLHLRYLKVHGVFLIGALAASWFYAFVYIKDSDLKHANIVRDKFMRCVFIVPILAVVVYCSYMLIHIVRDCFNVR